MFAAHLRGNFADGGWGFGDCHLRLSTDLQSLGLSRRLLVVQFRRYLAKAGEQVLRKDLLRIATARAGAAHCAA